MVVKSGWICLSEDFRIMGNLFRTYDPVSEPAAFEADLPAPCILGKNDSVGILRTSGSGFSGNCSGSLGNEKEKRTHGSDCGRTWQNFKTSGKYHDQKTAGPYDQGISKPGKRGKRRGFCSRMWILQAGFSVFYRRFSGGYNGNDLLPVFYGKMDEPQQCGVWAIQYCMGAGLHSAHLDPL